MSASHDEADRTRRVELPGEEIGPVPVSISHAEPRWFGVPPPLVLLLLALLALVGAVALFATGSWPYGLILVGVSALIVAGFLEVARRRPDSRLTGYAASSAASAREHAAAALDRLLVRSSAAAEIQRVRNAQAALETDRRTAMLELGEAVHRDNEPAAQAARARLAELDAIEADLHDRLARRLSSAEERIRRSKLSVQQTMVVVPEPYPPPDEGTPPTPAPVPEPGPNPQQPEPYPPPDEGTPPTPAPVPEPSPNPERDSRRPAA